MNAVVFTRVCPAPILNRKFQGKAQSFAYPVRGRYIEKVHVSVIFDCRYLNFFSARIERAERMEKAVGNWRHPLVWLQIRRLLRTCRIAVEGTPTGRQASPRPSPLCQERLRGEQESQTDNQITKSKLRLWRERNIGRQKSPLFLYVTEEWALSEKCQTKPDKIIRQDLT